MNKAKVENDQVVKYPYLEVDLIRDNPNTSFPINPLDNPSIRDDFNIVIVNEATKPSYNVISQKLVSGNLQKNGESWYESLVVVDKDDEVNKVGEVDKAEEVDGRCLDLGLFHPLSARLEKVDKEDKGG